MIRTKRVCMVGLVMLSALPLLSRAEGGIARLAEMHGSVLVAGNSAMASAQEGARLTHGLSVLTTSTGNAVVIFDDGCRVEVGPDRRYVVDREAACPLALGEKAMSAKKVTLAGPRS